MREKELSAVSDETDFASKARGDRGSIYDEFPVCKVVPVPPPTVDPDPPGDDW